MSDDKAPARAEIIQYQGRGEGMLASSSGFAHAQRVAQAFASSELIPAQWRGKVADCTIALAMAEAMGESPLVLLQSMHVVKGRAGFSATYMIARANRSGALRGRIGWMIEGEGDSLSVTARAVLADTGEQVEYTCTMAMARADGWTANTKYQSMPELMLRYRSATALVRLYLPDVMLGYHTTDELETLPEALNVTPAPARLSAPTVVDVPSAASVVEEVARKRGRPVGSTNRPKEGPPLPAGAPEATPEPHAPAAPTVEAPAPVQASLLPDPPAPVEDHATWEAFSAAVDECDPGRVPWALDWGREAFDALPLDDRAAKIAKVRAARLQRG